MGKSTTKNWSQVSVVQVGTPLKGAVTIDSAAAGRIVDATALTSIERHSVDLDALAASISSVAEGAARLDTQKWKLKRAQERDRSVVSEIDNCATRLNALLGAGGRIGIRRKLQPAVERKAMARQQIASGAGQPDGALWDEFLALLNDLASAVTVITIDDDADIEKFLIDTSPARFLAGNGLASVYSDFFKTKPGISRAPAIRPDGTDGTNAASGPYIRFVLAAFDELKIHKEDGTSYGSETVASALNEARKPKQKSE
jgi:hypothetical protein